MPLDNHTLPSVSGVGRGFGPILDLFCFLFCKQADVSLVHIIPELTRITNEPFDDEASQVSVAHLIYHRNTRPSSTYLLGLVFILVCGFRMSVF